MERELGNDEIPDSNVISDRAFHLHTYTVQVMAEIDLTGLPITLERLQAYTEQKLCAVHIAEPAVRKLRADKAARVISEMGSDLGPFGLDENGHELDVAGYP